MSLLAGIKSAEESALENAPVKKMGQGKQEPAN